MHGDFSITLHNEIIRTHFHYKRGMEYFLLICFIDFYICFRAEALSEAKKSIKEQTMLHSTLAVEIKLNNSTETKL